MGGIERFGLPKQGGVPASQAVKADGWLFVAGQVPKNAEGEFVVGGIAEQARQTLDNLMKTLRQAGYGPEDVVKVNVWLDDPRDFAIFNRIYMQRDANRVYGYTAQQTLDYAQSLYEKKLLTYPRTDSRYLPQDMAAGLSALAADMQAAMPFTDGLHLLFHAGQAVDDAQVTDHHALLPTGAAARADLAALPRSELDLLHLVCLRLLCALGEPCVICDITVMLACAGTQFTAKGQQVLEMGWTIPCETFRGHLQARGIAGPAKRPPELPENDG